MAKIIWTEEAVLWTKDIYDYITIDDPFYNLGFVADNSAGSLSNEDMDKLIYEA